MSKLPTQKQCNRSYIMEVITGSRVLYADSRLVALSIENSWAAAFWSEGTSWCIAESAYFSDYRRLGRLILFRLLNEGRNYLLSPANREFRNGRNRRLCLASFIKRFPKIGPIIRSMVGTDWKAAFYFGLVPENAQFEHSVNLMNLQIFELPNGLYVRDDLVLRGNPIAALPHQLFVGGELDIRDTNIVEIPDDVQVGNRIISDRAPINPKNMLAM
jgi:hypothetical protein